MGKKSIIKEYEELTNTKINNSRDFAKIVDSYSGYKTDANEITRIEDMFGVMYFAVQGNYLGELARLRQWFIFYYKISSTFYLERS